MLRTCSAPVHGCASGRASPGLAAAKLTVAVARMASGMGCPVRAVEIIAHKSADAIKSNHAEYVEYRRLADENMKRTQDKAQKGILEFAAGMAQLMAIFGGRRRGANVMRGLKD